MKNELDHLVKVRSMCRAALALGLVASLAANIVAADSSVVGRVVAGWPPLVLLIVVELIGRVSLDSGWLARARLATAGGIAAVAALVSYKHMLEVAELAGEGTVEAHLIPLTVDGLVVVASISLVGLNQRIRSAEQRTKPKQKPAPPASARPTTRTRPTRPTANGSNPGSAARNGLPALAASNGSQPNGSKPGGADGVERAARAAVLAREGRTQQEIAEELGVSVRTVRRDLKEVAA